MTREKEIAILLADGCTRHEAERHLQRGATIYTDLEENFDKYMEEWKGGISEEEVVEIKKMIVTGIPAMGWGVVKEDGSTYYIEYVL